VAQRIYCGWSEIHSEKYFDIVIDTAILIITDSIRAVMCLLFDRQYMRHCRRIGLLVFTALICLCKETRLDCALFAISCDGYVRSLSAAAPVPLRLLPGHRP
jgi:hypothetical protein